MENLAKLDIETYSWTKDKQCRFTSCCENVAQIAGTDSPQSLIGKSDKELIWRDRAAFYQEEEFIALKGKTIKQYQLQNTICGLIKIVVTKSPLLNKKGEVVGTIGSSINVTNTFLINKADHFDQRGKLHLGEVFGNVYLTKKKLKY